MQKCLQKQGVQVGPVGGGAGGAGGGGAGGGGNGANGGLGGPTQGGEAGAGGNRAAFNECLPERLRRFRATITTPEQTLRQVVDPPQTNISSSTYTIGGVDVEGDTIGIVTPSLVTKGRFLRGKNEALVTATYASPREARCRLADRPERHVVPCRRACAGAAWRADRVL